MKNTKEETELLREALIGAATGGHIEMLQWLLKKSKNNLAPGAVLRRLTRNGKLEALKVLLPDFKLLNKFELYDLVASAAKGGQIEVLKWLRAKGCAVNQDTYALAAQKGQVKMLQ